ncbi:hypothetical protein IAW_05811 [Bacillus cereus str. Schrouff]|uniref:hypothetical protein n=1 Tax=Bacillus cereus TaxID=1396 RepID=UPI00032EA534|nr:hypothetical protein [Bacillus cereus]EOO04993.1 hypothetical protein IAW_05811 [Bacillus cereus str. Schrouff]EOO81673.1 hypothetical protein IGY_05695 [Bacillus cereus K-5975c]
MTDKQLVELNFILQELQEAALSISSINDWKIKVDKYSVLFLGENFNEVAAYQLYLHLKNTMQFEVSESEFLILISITCKSLNFKIKSFSSRKNPKRLEECIIQLF